MKLKHYDLIQEPRLAWFGMKRFGCPATIRDAHRADSEEAWKMHCISERELEVDLFLSILTNIQKPHINLIEAGAGWGEWCMALAGVVEGKTNPVIPLDAETYLALGVEGDWEFLKHMKSNFEFNHLSAKPIYGALNSHNGRGKFNTGFISKNCCGGSISFDGTFKGSKLAGRILGLMNLLTGKSRKVKYYTIDRLVDQYRMDCLDILHIDVQGSEVLVLEGAVHSLAHRLIDYILVGTHASSLHSKVKRMLTPAYEIIVDVIPGKKNYVHHLFPTWIPKGQDGLLLFKRYGL